MAGYRFADFEIDLDGFALRRGGVVVPMQPKVFDVLRHLVERRGAVVSKNELLQTYWRNEHVNDSVVAWSISHIRRALGQGRGDRYPIETISGRGYRFGAEVAANTSSSSAPPAIAPAAPRSTTFTLVGRANVMADLEARVRAAVAGHGGLCILTGEAGIGKTRCADELLSVAGGFGAGTLFARCPQEPGAPLMWPIASALQELADSAPELSERASALLADAPGASDETQPVQPAAARFRLIEQVARLLRDLTASQPYLLVLDDLQWADAGTLSLLAFIAPELGEMHLCIVATMRPHELRTDSADQQPLQQLLRHAQSIALSALDTDQVAELIQRVEDRRPSQALADAVRRAASGVPLFVEQIVRSLVAEHGGAALSRLTPDAVRVPNLARDLLRERIQRLPAPTVELLSRAAVIGERFDLSLLLGLVELEPETLLERLEPAIAGGQLQSETPHTYRFVHALFQSVLYDDLPAAERVGIHRKLGLLLLSRTEDARRHADVARHFYLSLPAGDAEATLQHARQAGDRAQREYAYEHAVVYYTWALEAQLFGGTPEPRTRAELLLALATAQRLAGRTQDAQQTTTRLLELAQQQRMDDLVVRATRLRRPTVAMSMVPDALARAALEAVLEHSQAEASTTRVSALSQLACIPPYSLDLARSKELSARAVALARELPGAEATIEALRARLFSLSGPDDLDEVLTVADSMLAADAAGAPSWHSGDALSARYYAHVLAGRIDRADAALAQMTAVMTTGRWPEAVFFCQRLAAQRCFLDGAFAEAEARWERLYRDATRFGVAYAGMFYASFNMNLLLEREGARAVMTRWPAPAGSAMNLTPANRAYFARIAAEADDPTRSRAQLAVVSDPSGYTRDGHYLNLLANIAIAASRLDDKPRCEQLYGLLAPYAELNTPSQMGYYLGSVSHFLGLLAVALGRFTQAGTHFESALSFNRAMKYRAGVVRTLLAHGGLAARTGHRLQARDLLGQAADEARSLGMRAALDEAQTGLDRLG